MANRYDEIATKYIITECELKDFVMDSTRKGFDIIAIIPKLNTNTDSNNYANSLKVNFSVSLVYDVIIGRTELGKELYGN